MRSTSGSVRFNARQRAVEPPCRCGSGGGIYKASSFYVETILITTLDGQDFEFKAVMDIRPNGRLEATGFMDKMLEMGKFSVLKKHIELQKAH